ncbi:BrnA antitoxin family protein [Candidatus Glomeribacter gigasporarum]|uniref:BrnA antitoxin family protein n=1 Tax=Candidatus Glomeribacter gigasporarum TaxID=132144 RepID=UPI0002F3A219|nr:BrnA antitoxin family protein [Candidatus Glomeribacter gigasporarum]
MNESKKNTRTEWIDPDDAPELTDDFFEEADEYYGNTLIRRGRASAQKRAVKKRISVHLSADVIGRFCAAGPDWEARMNTVLSNWLKRHSPEELSV